MRQRSIAGIGKTHNDFSPVSCHAEAVLSVGDTLKMPDLVIEMRKAGNEVVDGNMDRVERTLAN